MLHRIGAVFYGLWGMLHLLAAAEGVRLATTVEPSLIQARLLQNSWNLAVFALVAMAVAATMNWRNSRTGYWINLITVSAADIGFIVLVLAPGYMPLWPGALGPMLWLLGVLFSTLGVRAASAKA